VTTKRNEETAVKTDSYSSGEKGSMTTKRDEETIYEHLEQILHTLTELTRELDSIATAIELQAEVLDELHDNLRDLAYRDNGGNY